MLSPLAFVDGATTSSVTKNSCPTGWGTVDCWDGASDTCVSITCAGTTAISGTGPFKFISRETTTLSDGDTYDNKVIFESFANHWNGDSNVDFVHVVHVSYAHSYHCVYPCTLLFITMFLFAPSQYDSSADVLAALKDGTLDAAIGAGVLDPSDIQELMYNDNFAVQHTDPIMNAGE
jgi:hypothetical protein